MNRIFYKINDCIWSRSAIKILKQSKLLNPIDIRDHERFKPVMAIDEKINQEPYSYISFYDYQKSVQRKSVY